MENWGSGSNSISVTNDLVQELKYTLKPTDLKGKEVKFPHHSAGVPVCNFLCNFVNLLLE